MTVNIDARMMDGVVRGALDYLRQAIAHRVEQNHGEHLVAAVALLLTTVLRMQDEAAPAVRLVNSMLAEAAAPVRV